MSFDKPIFHGLLHTNKPDLEALYRVGYIPMVTRAAIANYATTWPDPLGLPTAEWCDAMVSATAAPRGMILMDHEAWPYGTQAERQATAAKYVTLYQDIKARKPGWRIGWYTDPIQRRFFDSITDTGSAAYKTWQAGNTDLGAIMAPFTDVYFPSLYVHYSRDSGPQNLDWITTYVQAHIREAKRIRRVYGRMESPIYPYIWWRRADDEDRRRSPAVHVVFRGRSPAGIQAREWRMGAGPARALADGAGRARCRYRWLCLSDRLG